MTTIRMDTRSSGHPVSRWNSATARTISVAIGLVAVGAMPSHAHHASTGLYDRDTFGAVEGEIVSIFWRNPHVRLEVAREGPGGEAETWEIEFGSVNTLERTGFARDMIEIGDRIEVAGNLGRNGRHGMWAELVTLANGEELQANPGVERRYGLSDVAFARARQADTSLRADIFRVWIPVERPRTSRNMINYPLTAVGRAARESWDPLLDPALQCIPPGVPTAMDNPYPIEFENLGDVIELRLEEWDGVRTIFMNGATGEPEQPRMGRSTGRWDGRTLFIETTDIGWRYVDDIGTPQSEDAVIHESFTLSEDGTDLVWEARITDPVNFTEPVVYEGRWTWVQGQEVKPFNCALADGE